LYTLVKDVVGGGAKVFIGTGAVSTPVAVERTKAAGDVGADGALVITPFANKPSQNALIDYFSAVADVGIPVILYNVPGRTGTTIAPETAVMLSEHKNIVAIKEASGSLDAVSHILANSDLTVLSGDDSLTVPMMAIGAHGVISTTANLYPAEFADMVHSAQDGDFANAGELHRRLFPAMKALFIEGNPVPLKAAMAYKGLIANEICRPPLAPLAKANREKLIAVLEEFGS
ncbi:MAG TPA: 4-hydroxy-tetrahydrodipicolinate synthase, partial [candidate division Zixibacteria bacterium]|nr:4-hydroxy-tetrahydrodipicolinate synthase [candidate division Zixibacteria bacterium]